MFWELVCIESEYILSLEMNTKFEARQGSENIPLPVILAGPAQSVNKSRDVTTIDSITTCILLSTIPA